MPALRTERALVALAIHSQQLDERLARMEHQLDELATDERDLDLPTHEDLIEVRLHSARRVRRAHAGRGGAPGPHRRLGGAGCRPW